MIHTNIICRVEKTGSMYDLEPLFLDDTGQPYSKIINARTINNASYSRGDIVLVAITERNFADAVKGRKGNGGSKEKHELSSAVIVGEIT